MHVVVIYGWKEDTPEFTQAIAGTLGLTVFEVQQRMIGGGPSVIARFADQQQALELAGKLNRNDIATLVIDATQVRSRVDQINVRRFEFNESALRIETVDKKSAEIPYSAVDVALPGTIMVKHTETQTVTKREFSLGKTILAGGIPMRKKVVHHKEVATVKHGRVLYLYLSKRKQPVIFSQDGMTYDGLGAAMNVSRDLNFSYMLGELHRLCPGAVYDDRLQNRLGQVRLLGPALNPETYLDLAAEILSRCLRPARE